MVSSDEIRVTYNLLLLFVTFNRYTYSSPAIVTIYLLLADSGAGRPRLRSRSPLVARKRSCAS